MRKSQGKNISMKKMQKKDKNSCKGDKWKIKKLWKKLEKGTN